ncbi:MAG: ComEC/Rec2 family competence protein, partial [Phenylobacterium sp.]
MAIASLCVSGVLLLVARTAAGRPARSLGLVLLACLLAGFGLARCRTGQVRAPVMPHGGQVRQVEAWVLDVASPGQGGARVLLAPVSVSGLAPGQTPVRLRLTLRGEAPPPAPGTRLSVTALLNPPPPPSAPGAYDFARDAFFDGVGGVGLALGGSGVLPPDRAGLPWRLRLEMGVNALRWDITRRLVERMGPERGGLAAAMTTGHEAFVPPAQVEALRAAGLAHIISISGLHMAIVGGFVFGLVRLGVAAAPVLALRLAGRKIAAGAGIAAVLAYLVLSGAPDPAVRAAVTACAAFGAMLADRRAISLRTLAMAAAILLVLRPESVTQPGFQMSFAATAALVALAEAWPQPVREISAPFGIRLLQRAGTALVAGLMISLVAGLATGPFALQHFNRVALYGLPANLLAEPVSTLLLMPALALGVVLSPLGLSDLPLAVAGLGIDALNTTAATFAGLPGSERIVASAPPWALPAAFLGLLFCCLWRGPLRWMGLPLALA